MPSITYTNVAAEEISARTDKHPAIFCSTIHAFGWSLIKDFQPFLKERLPLLDKWPEKIEEAGGINKQEIIYDLGHRKIDDKEISLHHDDVLSFLVMLLNEQKFIELFVRRYPVVFIDEYQDTEIRLNALTITGTERKFASFPIISKDGCSIFPQPVP